MDSLDLKYAKSVIQRLTEKDTFMKSELFDIVTSNQVLDKLLDSLQRDGYIRKELSTYGRRQYSISLTVKGHAVAEQLVKAQEVAKGTIGEPTITVETDKDGEKIYVISQEYRKASEQRRKNLSALIHVNVLDDHITFKETNYDGTGRDRIVMIYVRLNHNGNMKLWCEADDSFDCWHVNEGWALPEVREMYFNQVKKGNVRK